MCYLFFFFNDTATTEIYTLSLHDALPIYELDEPTVAYLDDPAEEERLWKIREAGLGATAYPPGHPDTHERSEEHTSELQSQSNIVCRLLLEKKKHTSTPAHFFSIAMSSGH